MHTLQHRSADLLVERTATAGAGPTPLALLASTPSDVPPLLVLDAGEFLARCRRCDWSSQGKATPGAALATFAAHACEERPA